MEASHNVYICYRNKHIAVEKLHYHVATDLALLQANLSAMREKKGNDYHWIPELYQRLGLPLYEGIQTALLSYCQTRDSILEKTKEEESKRKPISWKIQRRLDGEQRKNGQKNMVVTGMAKSQLRAESVAQPSTTFRLPTEQKIQVQDVCMKNFS